YTVTGSAKTVDYTQSLTGTLTFAANVLTVTQDVTPVDDSLSENLETVVVSLISDPRFAFGASSATISIADNDLPAVSVTATQPNAAEEGRATGTWTLTRAGVLGATLTAYYVVDASSTASAADYDALAGSVTFGIGQATATVDLRPADDATTEPAETVVLRITTDAAYQIGSPSAATVFIADNDTPIVSVLASTPGASEAGPTKGVYAISRIGNLATTLTVNYAVNTASSTASSADYQPLAGSVTFLAGQSTAAVNLFPVDDSEDEPAETVILEISSGTGYQIGSPSSATVTIADNDLPTVTLAATQPSASETGPVPGIFTFTRVGDLSASLMVFYALDAANSTASSSDYQSVSGYVTFDISQSTATLTVYPADDSEDEPLETATFRISPNAAYLIGGTGSDAITIADDDLPTVSVAATTADASEAGPTKGVYTFTRVGDTSVALAVAYSVTGGTATPDDYQPLAGSINFGIGQSTATVDQMPVDDTDDEPAETVILTITPNASVYLIGDTGSATVTIADNDLPTVSVAATTADASEAGPTKGVYTFTRIGDTSVALTVAYTVTGSTATPDDYQPLAGSVTFDVGQTTATVDLMPVDDTASEPAETVILTITPNASAYLIGTPPATVTIADNDLPIVSVAATTSDASETGPTKGVYTFTRVGNTNVALTVAYAVTGSTATPDDYQPLTGSVTFGIGQSTATVDLMPVDDTADEPAETVILTITPSASDYLIGGTGSATVTIADNDLPAVSVAATANASEAGPTKGVYTFTRAGDTSVALTVAYAVTGGTASLSDYQPLAESVTFGIGQSEATVDLMPVDDTADEPDETVILTITAQPSDYVIGTPSCATVTLADDDLPSVHLMTTDRNASEQGHDKATYRFIRTGDLSAALTVYYFADPGGTASPSDYQPLSGFVTFQANQSAINLDLVPVDDSEDEPDETVTLVISPRPDYLVGAPTNPTVTIADNDLPTVSVAATDPLAAEAGLDKGTYTFTRVGDMSVALTVAYAVVGGTATPADYQPLAGSVTFEIGQAAAAVDLIPVDNQIIEPDKTVVLAITADPAYTVTGSPATVTINAAPVVTGVALNGRAGRGPGAVDPSGLGVQKIVIDFSEAVTFATGDVTVQTVRFPGGVEEVVTVPAASVAGSGTSEMTITLPYGAAVDTWVKVRLAGSAIADLAGHRLDGEARSGDTFIVDAATDLPTGNGAEGGDAVFYVGSLRGDMNLDNQITAADKAAFLAKWAAQDLDADFRGTGFGVRPPDGRITLGDMDGFASAYLAASAAGRSLAALPSGHPLGDVTPLPLLASAPGGVDILAEAAGKLPSSPVLPNSGSVLTATSSDDSSDPLKVRQAYATDDGSGAVLRI
ncbi:MAG: hypothetical protein NT049_07420, partial [Planctomycetota bacterium]|nr:hypothetical protein [Planctomycetota bacterium]